MKPLALQKQWLFAHVLGLEWIVLIINLREPLMT